MRSLVERDDHFKPLSWSFVRSPAAGDLRRPVRPGSLSGEILLSPSEAASGGVLPLDVPIYTSCPSCEGTNLRKLLSRLGMVGVASPRSEGCAMPSSPMCGGGRCGCAE